MQNGNGKDNEPGNDNKSGNDNSFSFDGLSLAKRDAAAGMLEGIDSTVASVTHPSAGDDNKFLGNGNGDGNGNGQGNGVSLPPLCKVDLLMLMIIGRQQSWQWKRQWQ